MFSNSVITLGQICSAEYGTPRERGQFLAGQLYTAQRASDAAGIDADAAATAAAVVADAAQ